MSATEFFKKIQTGIENIIKISTKQRTNEISDIFALLKSDNKKIPQISKKPNATSNAQTASFLFDSCEYI